MTINIKAYTTKDSSVIRDDILRTLRNGMVANGIANPQVGPGSDYYLKAQAIANELAVLAVNTQIKADAQMPDTAVGTELDRLLAQQGLARRAASNSTGGFTLDCSATTLVSVGAQMVDAAGLRYQVSVGGTYAAGSRVPLISIDTGKATNHAAGDALKWVAAPAFCNQTQIIASGGLTGGADVENDDTARARLYTRMQNPPGSGNWPQVNGFAEASTPIVQKGFCYPGVNGPSTCHVAVVGYATTVAKNRDVDSVTMAGLVTPYILGQMPEYVETIVTTVSNQPTDIGINLALPAAPTASPAGPGGGWLDGAPWPTVYSVTNVANVTAVTSSTVFTLNAGSLPTVGVSRIAFLDPTNWTTYYAKVLSYTGALPSLTITIDQPFPNIAAALALGGTGPVIFPQATNTATYVAALLAAMALMGPGEKTSNGAILVRGYRHPLPTQGWNNKLNASILRAITNAGNEVLDVAYSLGSGTTPTVPGSVASPPAIITPRHLGFYAM